MEELEELEARIQAVLNDPQQMQELMSLAKSLGLAPENGEEARTQPLEPQQQPAQTLPDQPLLPQGLAPMAALLQQAGGLDKKQENLLSALRPFLRPERREKLERAIQAARLSQLAGMAIRKREEKKL